MWAYEPPTILTVKIACAQVAKLKEEKSWLEGQVNAPDHAMPAPVPARAPIRHLSI